MKKIIMVIMCSMMLVLGVTGCTSKETNSNTETQKATVSDDKTEVRIPAEVNGKYFDTATRHGVVFKGGSNGEKSILRGLSDEKEFHDALLEIDAQPGNNLDMESKAGSQVDGEKLDVFVTWEGQEEIPFNDIVKTSEVKPMDIRFGGNLVRAEKANTGCILCLDSCPVGITSNHTYGTGSSEKVDFFGNKEILPKDGTPVTVVFRKAK